VDRALEAHGARRTIVLRLPHFATAPLAVRDSDALCTIASSVAERARELFAIELRTPPLELPSASVIATWSKRVDEDAGGRWFRSLFLEGHASSKQVRARMRIK
jgi:DNA-binding transcriptional LysR family regulator